jgi:hypothetical protein
LEFEENRNGQEEDQEEELEEEVRQEEGQVTLALVGGFLQARNAKLTTETSDA